MFNDLERPLREEARREPLAARARAMSESPTSASANGLKMIRVVSNDTVADTATIDVHCFNRNYLAAVAASVPRNVLPISGGTRLRGGSAAGQVQAVSIAIPDPALPVLRLVVSPIGDYSTYLLSLVSSAVTGTVKIDPLFSEIRFKFRPGCFNHNCAPEWDPALPPLGDPAIDYQAKDYGSFRDVMLDAMRARVPDWQPTSEADLDMVIAELFSVAADELSDYQDRMMNEAYLASARKRVSLARHARLMDYHIHQGNQASTWLALEIGHDAAGQKSFEMNPGLLAWAGDTAAGKPAADAAVFRSRHDSPQAVHQYLNSIGLYTWSDTITTLKAGSTRADLALYNALYLDGGTSPAPVTTQAAAQAIRDLIRQDKVRHLVVTEHLNPRTGLVSGRDPRKRQLLRLVADGAEALNDPITGEWFVRVRWEKTDALRHAYCFTVDCPADGGATAGGSVRNVSLFHGNLVEVCHGRTRQVVFKEESAALNPAAAVLELHYERTAYGEPSRWGALCRLPDAALAYRTTAAGGDVPPMSTLEISVGPANDPWDEVPSLIHSLGSSENGDHFVVETDEDRRSIIRFGNGRNGRELPDRADVRCTYQYGLPLAGNVGLDTIAAFAAGTVQANPPAPGITLRACWNPFDVTSGVEREPVEQIIRRVPEAYRHRQLRAVTLADYVARAEEVSGVSRASAVYAWTGSWRTVRVTIDPIGTTELSVSLRARVSAYLNAVRLIGEDLEIRAPQPVPLDINVVLCASAAVWPEDIQFVLEQEFSTGWTPDGRRGFFHPDDWTFGQPLHASQIIGRVLRVDGVEHTVSVAIRRWNSPFAAGESLTQLAPNEIIQVMNDPDHREWGFTTFTVQGGRR